MRALDASTGKLLWAYEAEAILERAAPEVVADVVYFNTRGGFLHALDAVNGKLLWRAAPRDFNPLRTGGGTRDRIHWRT